MSAIAAADNWHSELDSHDDVDSLKRQLITAPDQSLAPPAADAPIWRLKRLRPAFLSVGLLAGFTACLTGCAPLVPDQVRELRDPFRRQPPPVFQLLLVSRLLSPLGQCVAIENGTDVFHCASAAPPTCADLSALCRYRAGMLACQTATPVCLLAGLGLLALAVCAARHCDTQRRLLLAAAGFVCAGLAATVTSVACLHALVAELTASASSSTLTPEIGRATYYYSADTTGARLAYAAICLQTLLAGQLACLPAWLYRVTAARACMLAWALPPTDGRTVD